MFASEGAFEGCVHESEMEQAFRECAASQNRRKLEATVAQRAADAVSSGFVTADEQQAAAGESDIIPCGEDVGYLDGELICGSDALAEAAAEDNAKGAYLESGDINEGCEVNPGSSAEDCDSGGGDGDGDGKSLTIQGGGIGINLSCVSPLGIGVAVSFGYIGDNQGNNSGFATVSVASGSPGVSGSLEPFVIASKIPFNAPTHYSGQARGGLYH